MNILNVMIPNIQDGLMVIGRRRHNLNINFQGHLQKEDQNNQIKYQVFLFSLFIVKYVAPQVFLLNFILTSYFIDELYIFLECMLIYIHLWYGVVRHLPKLQLDRLGDKIISIFMFLFITKGIKNKTHELNHRSMMLHKSQYSCLLIKY